MKHQPKYARRHRKKSNIPVILLSVIAAALLFVVIFLAVGIPAKENGTQEAETETAAAPRQKATEAPTVSAVPTETTIPQETEAEVLPIFQDMAVENPDMAGWISIEDTKLNYPLMYAPDEPEKYLHKDFQGEFSIEGLPFIDESCTLEPASDNLLIYGHNMANGTMFHCLLNYEQKTYWEAHPVILMSTLYEQNEYEIIAALYDRIYFTSDTCFKFYQFIDAADEDAYNEAITYFKEHSLYDTGVTAQYGDKLITLVTCAYHVDNGRFLVVAKEITD